MLFKKRKKAGFFQRKISAFDAGLIKGASFAFALFLASFFPVLADPVLRWFWLLVAIFLFLRPCYNFWFKN